MRKKWTAGDPCPKCKEPVWAESDRYKPGRSICHPCGKIERNNEQAAARAKTAQPCRVCNCVLVGNDKRHAACKPCRMTAAAAANAERKCPCGASIAHRSKNARFCDKCSSRQRAKGAMAGGVAARRKLTKERLPEVVARPVAQAWPGLRGPGGEWEHGVTSVQGWATLDGARV